MDYGLFAAAAALGLWKANAAASSAAAGSCDELRNSAFVFVKPHANTAKVQDLVRDTLKAKGVSILSESDISGDVIDEKKLIDQHYYAIGMCDVVLARRAENEKVGAIVDDAIQKKRGENDPFWYEL